MSRRDKKSEFLFVYGTLRKALNHPLSHFLMGNATFEGMATVYGKLYDVGRYPALTSSNNPDDAVVGEVYRLKDVSDVLSKLDDYEGCGPNDAEPTQYRRLPMQATMSNHEKVQTWVYVYNWTTEGLTLIPDGDYMAYVSQK